MHQMLLYGGPGPLVSAILRPWFSCCTCADHGFDRAGLLERLKRSETERRAYDKEQLGKLDHSTQGQVVGTIMQEYLDTKVSVISVPSHCSCTLTPASPLGAETASQGVHCKMPPAALHYCSSAAPQPEQCRSSYDGLKQCDLASELTLVCASRGGSSS